MAGFNSRITKSPITYSPSFQRPKHIIEEPSAAEYKTAASISTRNIGTLRFVVQTAETLRSIVQMRYASNPGQIQVGYQHRIYAEVCSPVLNILVASVEARKVATQ